MTVEKVCKNCICFGGRRGNPHCCSLIEQKAFEYHACRPIRVIAFSRKP